MPGLHDRLWRAQRGVCPVCNLLLSVPVHIDHKIPLSRTIIDEGTLAALRDGLLTA